MILLILQLNSCTFFGDESKELVTKLEVSELISSEEGQNSSLLIDLIKKDNLELLEEKLRSIKSEVEKKLLELNSDLESSSSKVINATPVVAEALAFAIYNRKDRATEVILNSGFAIDFSIQKFETSDFDIEENDYSRVIEYLYSTNNLKLLEIVLKLEMEKSDIFLKKEGLSYKNDLLLISLMEYDDKKEIFTLLINNGMNPFDRISGPSSFRSCGTILEYLALNSYKSALELALQNSTLPYERKATVLKRILSREDLSISIRDILKNYLEKIEIKD